jgi:hypothetical protein
MPPSLFRIQRLFIIAGYLVHMTAQGSRSAIKGLPSRKEWGEGTRTDGDVWKYIRPGSLYVRETEARDGLILSAGSSGKHRGEHNHDGDQDDEGDGEAVARHVLGVVDGTKTGALRCRALSGPPASRSAIR